MSHKRHYVLTINGEHYDVYCDTLPTGLQSSVGITLRTRKIAERHTGPNYDGSANSIRAALLYADVHPTARMLVWRHLYDRCGTFVSGADLIERYGTAALERVRELRYKYGWPIEAKSPEGHGVWWYRLNVQQPPRRRIIRRRGS